MAALPSLRLNQPFARSLLRCFHFVLSLSLSAAAVAFALLAFKLFLFICLFSFFVSHSSFLLLVLTSSFSVFEFDFEFVLSFWSLMLCLLYFLPLCCASHSVFPFVCLLAPALWLFFCWAWFGTSPCVGVQCVGELVRKGGFLAIPVGLKVKSKQRGFPT